MEHAHCPFSPCTQGEKVAEGRMRGPTLANRPDEWVFDDCSMRKPPSPGLSPNSYAMTRLCDGPCTLANELGERGQHGAVQLGNPRPRRKSLQRLAAFRVPEKAFRWFSSNSSETDSVRRSLRGLPTTLLCVYLPRSSPSCRFRDWRVLARLCGWERRDHKRRVTGVRPTYQHEGLTVTPWTESIQRRVAS